jgi:hypothetical protein
MTGTVLEVGRFQLIHSFILYRQTQLTLSCCRVQQQQPPPGRCEGARAVRSCKWLGAGREVDRCWED